MNTQDEEEITTDTSYIRDRSGRPLRLGKNENNFELIFGFLDFLLYGPCGWAKKKMNLSRRNT
jgi:hypothetical protein